MEIDGQAARAQLEELDRAVDATRYALIPMPPFWFYAGIALVGPGMVGTRLALGEDRGWTASQVNQLLAASVGLLAIALAALVMEFFIERKNPVRPLAPIRGGKTTPWMFAFTFSIIAGLMVTGEIGLGSNPHVPAILSFFWFLLVPRYLFGRHIKAMAATAAKTST